MACSNPRAALDEGQVRGENRQLLNDILKFCQRSDHKSGENIILLGRSGGGKSALINTVFAALSGFYLPKARAGKGTALTKTLELQWFPHCGLTKDDIKDSPNEDILKQLLPVLPNIFDAAGMGDEDSPEREEILKLLFGGYIQPGTNIKALEKLQREQGVGNLQHFYSKANPDWRIHKMVYVQSGKEGISKNLVQCIQRVLDSTDPVTNQLMFNCERFVVITYHDLVDDSDDDIEVLDRPVLRSSKHVDSEEQPSSMSMADSRRITIKQKDFIDVEKRIAKEFSILGQLEFNRIRWKSCCDTVGFDDPYVFNTALKFVKLMVTPGAPSSSSVPIPVVSFWKMQTLRLKKFLSNEQNINVTPGVLLMGFAGLIFVVLLYWLFSKGV